MLTKKKTPFSLVFSDRPAERDRPSRNYKEQTPDVPGSFSVWYDVGADLTGDSVTDSDRTVHGEEHLERPTFDIGSQPRSN